MSDEQIEKLPRGGHDYRKVYAAFDAATKHVGQPTVILAHTIKGWTIDALEGKNATHQMKKLTQGRPQEVPRPALPADQRPRHRRGLRATGAAPFFHPGKDSPEIEYMLERRRAARRLAAQAGRARQAAQAARRRDVRRAQAGLGQEQDRHHHGRRPAARATG